MTPYHSQHNVTIYCDDCVTAMQNMEDNSIDAIVTDPPYGLSKQPDIVEVLTHWLNGDDYEHTGGGFMGRAWDSFVPGPSVWRECLRVLKPGGHLLAFAGTRTVDLMGISLRLGGFEIRDMVAWVFGQGFPKSLDIGKAIDKVSQRFEFFKPFAEHFRKQRQLKGLTQNDIAKHFLSKTGGLTGCVWNWENAANVPTKQQFKILKPMLGLSNKFDNLIERIESERKVIGQNNRKGKPPQPMWGEEDGQSWKITAPATPEAKQYEGFGTGLKPAIEPVLLCRKPISEKNIASNVLRWGTGGINIDGCRVGYQSNDDVQTLSASNERFNKGNYSQGGEFNKSQNGVISYTHPKGRFPANLILSDDDEVRGLFPESKSGGRFGNKRGSGPEFGNIYGKYNPTKMANPHDRSGSAARFFYTAKSSKAERNAGLEEGITNGHPCVKPLSLMRYLCRLIAPPNGLILDPFAGSGSTLIAAREENFKAIGVELEEDYCQIAVGRLSQVQPNLFNVGD